MLIGLFKGILVSHTVMEGDTTPTTEPQDGGSTSEKTIASSGDQATQSGSRTESHLEEPMNDSDAGAVREKEEGAASSDSCKFDSSWSTLPREEIIDKVKGVIYGQAIGDALGLATEFMTKEMAKGVYGKKGPSGYSVIYQDFHRSRWDAGDWTDDTDQMLLILQMINDCGGRVDKLDFAKRIHNWMLHGFSEFGDIGGMGIGMTVSRTLRSDTFLTDPQSCAQTVWERSGKYLAANGAIMRTSLLGVLDFNDLEKVVANTTEICRVTHADPRCIASCIAMDLAIALMLQGKYNPGKKSDLKLLVDACIRESHKALEHSDQKAELTEHVNSSSLDKLKLYDQHTMGYTYKALGAGFFALRNSKDFREMLLKVIMEAGDADSNGAVCGALMGCKFGFKALPQDLLAFPHREWLDQQVDKFLTTIGLI